MENNRIQEGFKRVLLFSVFFLPLIFLPEWYSKFREGVLPEDLKGIFDTLFAIFYKFTGIVIVLYGTFWVINGFIGKELSGTVQDSQNIDIHSDRSIQFGIAVLICLAVLVFLKFLFSP